MTVQEIVFLAVFFALVFVVPALVAWASYTEGAHFKGFDVRDLWTHNGRADKFAVIILGTWWVHTCSMVMWTLLQSVTTTDYVTYMGWALPLIIKMWAPPGTTPTDKP